MKIDKIAVDDLIEEHAKFNQMENRQALKDTINALPTTDDGWVSVEKYNQVKHDADIMFDALFAIISDDTIDDLDKCMKVASKSLNSIIDKTRNDTI